MKRFITYVYVYENGVKGKNAGFIKAELRDGRVRMEVQLRGIGRYQGKVDMDLIVPAQEKDSGIRLPFGEVEFHHGMANAYLEDSETQIAKSNYDFQQVAGVRMDLDETHYLASCWVENAERCVCHPRAVRNQNSEQKSNCGSCVELDCDMKSNCGMNIERNPAKTANDKKREEQYTAIKSTSDKKQEQDFMRCRDCVEKADQNSTRQPNKKREEQDCTNSADYVRSPECNSEKRENTSPTIVEKVQRQILEKEQGECSVTLRKIDISDIHKFPKQNWYLCNNSFLIHGFFNYHYLVVKKVTEHSQTKYYLGVPGVYDKPERMMALLFGFPEFEVGQKEDDMDNVKPQKQVDCQAVNQSKEETQATGNFGYWYCLLDM